VNDFALEFRGAGPIYLGQLNGSKLFLGQTNWGLGVVVNRWVGKILRALPFLRSLQNPIGALCLIAAHVLRRELVCAEINIDGKKISGTYSIILVSQIKHWAGGMYFCPAADAYSPKFQLVLVERSNLIGLLRNINLGKVGKLTAHEGNRITIKLQKPQSAQVDGDLTAPAMEFHSSKIKTQFSLRSSGDLAIFSGENAKNTRGQA